VFADKGRIRQILINLIGNAFKFTEKGSISLKIKLEYEHGDSVLLRFSLTDTGIGISEKQMNRLFQTYSQANDRISIKYGGSGLVARSVGAMQLADHALQLEKCIDGDSDHISEIINHIQDDYGALKDAINFTKWRD